MLCFIRLLDLHFRLWRNHIKVLTDRPMNFRRFSWNICFSARLQKLCGSFYYTAAPFSYTMINMKRSSFLYLVEHGNWIKEFSRLVFFTTGSFAWVAPKLFVWVFMLWAWFHPHTDSLLDAQQTFTSSKFYLGQRQILQREPASQPLTLNPCNRDR